MDAKLYNVPPPQTRKSKYFNFESHGGEQHLLQSLVTEIIRNNGTEVYYLPRKHYNRDTILQEEPASYFDEAYLLNIHIDGAVGWGGQGDFMNKFGLTVEDQATFTVSRETFKKNVPNTKFERPWAGDLIFYPKTKYLFEIKFVEDERPFFELGRNYTYEMRCEAFVYSHERFSTGIGDIDSRQLINAYAVTIVVGNGNNVDFIIGETVEQANTGVTAKVSNWTNRPVPTLELEDISGEFTNSNAWALTGEISGATYYILSDDIISIPNDYTQNKEMDDAGKISDNFDESSPFGTW